MKTSKILLIEDEHAYFFNLTDIESYRFDIKNVCSIILKTSIKDDLNLENVALLVNGKILFALKWFQ